MKQKDKSSGLSKVQHKSRETSLCQLDLTVVLHLRSLWVCSKKQGMMGSCLWLFAKVAKRRYKLASDQKTQRMLTRCLCSNSGTAKSSLKVSQLLLQLRPTKLKWFYRSKQMMMEISLSSSTTKNSNTTTNQSKINAPSFISRCFSTTREVNLRCMLKHLKPKKNKL